MTMMVISFALSSLVAMDQAHIEEVNQEVAAVEVAVGEVDQVIVEVAIEEIIDQQLVAVNIESQSQDCQHRDHGKT